MFCVKLQVVLVLWRVLTTRVSMAAFIATLPSRAACGKPSCSASSRVGVVRALLTPADVCLEGVVAKEVRLAQVVVLSPRTILTRQSVRNSTGGERLGGSCAHAGAAAVSGLLNWQQPAGTAA